VSGSIWLITSAAGGGITLAEGLRDWGRRAVPLLNCTLALALQPRKSTENTSQCSRIVGKSLLRRLGCLLRDSLCWPAGLQVTTVSHGLQSALGWRKSLSSCRTKGFPASANFESKLSASALLWSAKNGITKSS
jgi:hypothetical protein